MKRLIRILIVTAMVIPPAPSSWAASAGRTLPQTYTPGVAVPVSILVTPDTATLVYAVEDAPPTGWVVSAMDNSGVWDGNTGKVKWGPFFDNTARTFTYQATPPLGTTGTKSFAGIASFDGINNPAIGGNLTINAAGANQAPIVAIAATAALNSTGTLASLSVLGADDAGEAALTYTWSTTGTPPAPVTFTASGNNAAKNSSASFTKIGTYNLLVRIADAAGAVVTSTATVTINPILTAIAVAPSTATVTMTKTQQFTASAKDQFSAPLTSQPALTWTATGGTISSTGLFTAGSIVGGPFTVTATASGKSGTASVVVSNNSPTIANPPSAVLNSTGTLAALSVLGADDAGESGLVYTWAVVGTPPAAVTFSTNNSNAAKNSFAVFTKAGSYTLSVTVKDAANSSTTANVTVVLNQLATTVTVSPSSASVQTNGTKQFAASAADQFGALLSSQPIFTWSVGGGGSISSTGMFTAGNTAGGPFTVTANANGKSGMASVTVTAAPNGPPTVATAASATLNAAGTQATLSTLGADDAGESTLKYIWSTTGTPPAPVTFSVNETNAAKNSVAVFTKLGTYNFLVTITDSAGASVTSAITLNVTAVTTSVSVSPSNASVTIIKTQQFSASASDQFGTALISQPTFSWAVSGGGAISATGLFTAGSSPGGPFTVTATGNGKSNTATVTVTNLVPTIATNPTATLNASQTVATLAVLGSDDTGETNLIYTWATAGTAPAPVTFSANGSNAAKNATATFTKAGSYTLAVTIRDPAGLTASANVSVVVNQLVTTVAITPSSASVQTNATRQFTALATDQFGAAMVSQPSFTWTVSGGGIISATGLFTAGNSSGGPFTVTGTGGGKSGTASVTVTVAPNIPPTVATAASAILNAAKTQASLSVIGADDAGEAALTYTWSTTGTTPAAVTFSVNGTNASKNSVATFTKMGTYNFLVTITDAPGATVTSTVSVNVTAQTTSISVSPSNATVAVTKTLQFTASASDQFGTAVASQPTFTWMVSGGGSISSTGLFTAGSTVGGPFTVTATGGGKSNTAFVTITNTAPTVATPASAIVNAAGTQVTLAVLGADDAGEGGLNYNWSTTGIVPAPVTFSINGSNAAKNSIATLTKIGTYNFLVTMTDGTGATATSAVSINVSAVTTSVSVSPSNASVATTKTQQFTAAAADQFGSIMVAQPTFTWTVSGGGTISSTGLFTAGSTVGGPFTVTATGGGKSNTVSVTITNTAPTVATSASATLNAAGTMVTLSVLGADDTGESGLTYTWSTTGVPPAPVSFSMNGTNNAKSTSGTLTKIGSYNFLVTIKDGTGATVTSAVSLNVAALTTTVSVSPANVTVIVTKTQQFTASASDQFGSAMASQPTFSWTVSGGGSISSTGLFTAGNIVGGPFTVIATGGGKSNTATITVGNAAPTVATPARATLNLAGTQASLSVLGADDVGEGGLTYNWTTTGTPSAPVTFSINGTNEAKNSSATFTKIGTYNFLVTITDGSGSTVTSAVSLIVSAVATAVSVSPTNATVTMTKTQQFTALAADQFGATMAAQPTFTWTVSGGGSISSTGLFTAGNVAGGPFTVTASANGKSNTATVTISNNVPTFATAPTASLNATQTTATLAVLGADDTGEAGLTYVWSSTGSVPAAVTFSANNSNAAKNSTATFSKAGSYTLRVTISDSAGLNISANVTVVVNQISTAVTVAPASVGVQTNGTQQFTAAASDQFAAAMASQPTFTWTVNGGGSISSTGMFNAGNSAGGPFTITATGDGKSGTASVTVTLAPNNSPTVATAASATLNSAGTQGTLSVLGADDAGEAGLKYTWATTGTPPAPVTFSINGTNASKNTVATFTKIGTYNFRVTITDAAGLSVTSSVSLIVSALTSTVVVSPANVDVHTRATQQFSAAAKDQFGVNLVSVPNFAWSVSAGGTISSTGTLTTASVTSGPNNVTATTNGKSGTATFNVVNLAPTITTAASATLNAAKTAANLAVVAADDSGEASLSYTWSTINNPPALVTFSSNGTNAAKNTTVTFIKAGTYDLKVVIADVEGLTNQSQVTVVVAQQISNVSVSPSSATVQTGSTQQFIANGTDQFGSLLVSQPTFTWTVTGGGSIVSSGLFTAGNIAGGPFTVTANSSGKSGNASLTVTTKPNSPPTVSTAASGIVNAAGTTANLSVLGADDAGESTLTYSWATTGTAPAPVTFSVNGTNAAKNTAATFTKIGAYNFIATITDGSGATVTSAISLNVAAVTTSLIVSPSSATVAVTKTQQFTGSARDQFSVSLITQPAFTWVMSGGGSVNSSGLFTAGNVAGGPFTLTASASGKSNTASIMITNASPTIATAPTATLNSTGTGATLAVLGADDTGETGITYSWATTGNPPAPVIFSVNGSNAAKNSTATFTKTGSYTLLVTLTDSAGLTTSATITVNVNQISTSVLVIPASIGVQANSSQQFTASASDQFGTAMNSQPSFVWTVSGGGSVSASGLFTAGNTAGGPFTVTATGSGKSGTASVSVTDFPNAAPVIAVAAKATLNSAGTQAVLSVLGADDAGEAGLTYTWTTTGTVPASVTFSVNGNNAAKNSAVTFSKIGTYTMKVTITDAVGLSVTSNVSVSVSAMINTIGVSPINVNVHTGSAQQFTAIAQDQFGTNLSTAPTFAWTVSGGGLVSASGLLTASLTPSGPNTITASAGGKNGTATFNAINLAPTVATSAAATLNASKTAANLSVLANDDGGESSLVYDWMVLSGPALATFSQNGTNGSKNTVVTFTTAGSYDLRVVFSDPEGFNNESPLTIIVPETISSIALAPSVTTIETGNTQQFVATSFNQFGEKVSAAANYSWTASGGGSINANGLFTAGNTAGGSFIVSANRDGQTGTASVTINSPTNTAPIVTANASAMMNFAGTAASLDVLATDDGGEANLTYTWDTTGIPPAPVVFANNGTNSSKNTTAAFSKIGSYNLLVIVRDQQGATTTSVVTVTVGGVLSAISVSPSQASVSTNMTQQFSASSFDQFEEALTLQGTISWTVSGGGSISATGLFTAGNVPGGPFLVSAINSTLTGVAEVTVTGFANNAPTVYAGDGLRTNELSASLNGTASDDGVPNPLTVTWSFLEGPAPVTFDNSNILTTTVHFILPGTYHLRLTADDGQLSRSDDVLIVVESLAPAPQTGTLSSGFLSVTNPFVVSRDHGMKIIFSVGGDINSSVMKSVTIDVWGRDGKVATIFDSKVSAGTTTDIFWNGRGSLDVVGSGTYMLVLNIEGEQHKQKIVIVR